MKRSHKITLIAVLVCLMASCLVLASCNLDIFNFHSHTYENVWYYDQTYHWKECVSCGKETEKLEHRISQDGWVIVEEPSETQAGLRRGRCTVCDNLIDEEIAPLDHEHNFTGKYSFNESGHWQTCACGQRGESFEHNFAGDYSSDEYGHWQTCVCGQRGELIEHNVATWTVDVAPTETTQGQQSGVCSVCKSELTQTIPVLGHTHNYSNTLSYDDTYHYRECSCGDKTEVTLHLYSDEWQSDATNHWQQCECGRVENEQAHVKTWVIDKPATTTATGLKHEECTVCGKNFGSQTIDKLPLTTRTVDIYSINDFHGAVDKISSVGGYLKQQKNSNANTVIINSGDMFQGSMESNSNYGKLLTDCMDQIGFDAFTFGNHEFDWGLEKLGQLANGSNVPFLGANIYHWNASSKTWGTFASELAQEYVIKELDNGLRVGIIGVIGEDQITSISSNLVQTIGFKDPLPIIKTLATKLRNDEACDVVIVSAHVGPQGLVGESENNQQPSSAGGLESYVNAVFCAHTHRAQVYVVDGLPFIQGGSYGSYVSNIKLTVSANGDVTFTEHQNISHSNSWPNISVVDSLINNSNAQIEDERNQVVANLDSYLNSNPQLPRLVCNAMADYAVSQGYDITLAITNTARSSVSSGSLTYSELYEAIPFDNVVYIAKVSGSDLLKEVEYQSYGSYANAIWRVKGDAINSSDYYYIAVIDYILFHQNSYRNYNYFPSAFTSGFTPVPLTNDNYEVYNYRLITRDFIMGKNIATSVYRYDNNNNDNSLIRSDVAIDQGGSQTTTPTVTHAGTLADPYDIADALLLGADYTAGNQAPSIYVKCIVSNVSYIQQNSSSGDLGNFYVRDETGNSIKVYYVSKSRYSNNWTSTDDLKVGDVLVMYIASYVYNGTTPQLGFGYCISINGEPTY